MHTTPSNKRYIGITKMKVQRRWGSGRGYKEQYFYKAIQKYGWDNIQHEIVASNLTKDEAESFEILLIRELKSNDPKFGYNIDNGGKTNGRVSDSTKRKLSEINSGRNHPNFGKALSDETKEKMRKAHIGKGHPHTEETKKKLSETKKSMKMNHNSKKVECENIEYESIKECADFYGINLCTMARWLNGKRKMPQKFADKGLKYL